MTQLALFMAAFSVSCTKLTDEGTGSPRSDVDADVDVDVDDTGQGPLDCFALEPRAEVGTGETTFEGLSEDEPVVMVHGPQGGWHMLGGVRIHNMEPIIDVHFTIADEITGTIVSDNNYRVAVVQDGECTGFYPGMYGYLEVSDLVTEGATRPPEVLGYKTVVMTMDVTDYGDRTASASVRVIAQPDPADLDLSGDGVGDSGDHDL